MKIRASKLRYLGARHEQQDAVSVFHVRAGVGNEDYAVGILTDGIGGLAHGREASELVNAAARAALEAALKSGPDEEAQIGSCLQVAALSANGDLRNWRTRNEIDACGTTLVIAVLHKDMMHFLSIGDSALLVMDSEGELQRVNDAHVRRVKDRSFLASAVTGDEIEEIDQRSLHLDRRSTRAVLLASDGIESLPLDSVAAILADEGSDKLSRIVDLASETRDESQDNLGMVLFELG